MIESDLEKLVYFIKKFSYLFAYPNDKFFSSEMISLIDKEVCLFLFIICLLFSG